MSILGHRASVTALSTAQQTGDFSEVLEALCTLASLRGRVSIAVYAAKRDSRLMSAVAVAVAVTS